MEKIYIYSKKTGLRRLKPGITLAITREHHPECPDMIQVYPPDIEDLNEFEEEAIDGCRVEPDGTCPHGYPSWLLAYGMI